MENLLEESVVLDRLVWPYVLGRVGGVVIMVAAVLLMRGDVHGFEVFAGGAGLLAVAWFRLAKTHATIAPAFGSLSVVAAIAVGNLSSQSVDEVRTSAMAIFVSFAVFAVTHMVPKGLVWLRVFAGLALLATLMMVPVRGFDEMKLLFDAMQICFALVGGAIAFTLPRLGGSSRLQG